MPPERLEPQLLMLRPTLEHLPAVDVPPGYRIRALRPDEGLAWERISDEVFETHYDFAQKMLSDAAYKPGRVLVATTDDDEPVATASAWFRATYGASVGYLHMVGVRTAHRGRRLGYHLSLAVLHRLREEGFTSAVLRTDDARLAAIRTYLHLGFEPRIVDENQRGRWRAIAQTMEMTQEFSRRFAATLDGPMYA